MIISKSRVLSADSILKNIGDNRDFRLLHDITNDADELLTKIGFPVNPPSGSSILPTPRGASTRLNAYGKFVPRKDLPKELRYITTLEWTREQWAGPGRTETVTTEVDVTRNCYQRELLPPTSLELSYIFHDNRHLICSDILNAEHSDPNQIKTYANIFFELFRMCEIAEADLQALVPRVVEKKNWSFLPPGERPWEQVQQHLDLRYPNWTIRKRNPIRRRQAHIANKDPNRIVVGNGGFRDYVAYVFDYKGLCVLESCNFDNATYVFNSNWERLSQLTKAEILQNNLHVQRIIHDAGWYDSIDATLA
ncbi:hypothetical protein ACTU44_11135 [Thalassospira sp. SM2505]